MTTTSTQSPLFIWPKNQLVHGATKACVLCLPWHLVYASFASTPGTARGVRAVQDGTAVEPARSMTGLFPKNLTETSALYNYSKAFATPTTSPAECTKSSCLSSPNQHAGAPCEGTQARLKQWLEHVG